MIPANFDYHRPASVDEAVGLIEQHGDDGAILAGGHSLIPMMKLRFATPGHLIDLKALDELRGIEDTGADIRIGAMTTQAELQASAVAAEACPILAETVNVIADPQVRNLGTVGGNVANGDPGNDMPAVMMALGAIYVLKGPGGERETPANGFYKGIYDTERAANELLIAIRVPKPPAGHGYAYKKLKRKVGDYATAAAAVILVLDGGACGHAAIALTNVGPTALDADDAAKSLIGSNVDGEAIAKAAELAMEICDPVADMHGPVEYRRKMAGVMTFRAIAEALGRAKGG